MIGAAVPEQVVHHGPEPQGGTICQDCGKPYVWHSGATCLLCSRPVEHHTQAEIDAELAAAAHLAAARLHAGHPLRPHEQYALDAQLPPDPWS